MSDKSTSGGGMMMDQIVVRHYEDASILVNRATKRSAFIEGPLASQVPLILNDPSAKPSPTFLAEFDPHDVPNLMSDYAEVQRAICSLSDATRTTNETRAKSGQNDALQTFAAYAVRNWQIVHVNLEMTYRCNQRCAMCYLDNFHQKGMSSERLLSLASDLKVAGALFVLFTGGEVFLRQDALDLMQHYEDMGFVLEIKTNGTVLSPAIIKRLTCLHPFDIQVSIYDLQNGYSEITRSHYPFDNIVDSVRRMCEGGLPVTLSILVGKHNIDSLERIHDRLNGLGAEVFYSPYITPNRAATGAEAIFRLSRQDMEEKLGPFLNRLNAFPERRKYRACGDESVVCYAGRDQIAIDPSGVVYPCLDLREPLGDLNQNTLSEIIAYRRDLLTLPSLDDMPICNRCPDKEYCDCCIGVAIMEHGDYRQPSSHKCDVTRFYGRERR